MTHQGKLKVILISYFFSSKYDTGGMRAQAFAKYLPGLGFEPIVITKRRKDHYDFTGRCIVLRTVPVNWPFHLEAFTWLPGLFLTCLKIVRNEKVRILLFSCGPFSSAVVGYVLKKLFNLKLVLDYRDYWTLSPYLPKIPKFNRILNHLQKPLEKLLLRSVDRLIVIQKAMENRYKETFPFLDGKILTIYNGFDEEDITYPEGEPFEKFTISYLGNLHLNLNVSYPNLFLQCIQKIKENQLIDSSNFQVLIVGERFEAFEKKVSELGISEFVKCLGRLPHAEALTHLRKSHLLLLIVETEGIITSKVFEYLATGKPILALIKEGEIKELIDKYSKNSYTFTSPDIGQMVMAVIDCRKNYLSRHYQSNESFVARFNRRRQTMQLARSLEQLMEGSGIANSLTRARIEKEIA